MQRRERQNTTPHFPSTSPVCSFRPFWILEKYHSCLQPKEALTSSACWAFKSTTTMLGLEFKELSWVSPILTFKRKRVQSPVKVLGLQSANKCCSSPQPSRRSGLLEVMMLSLTQTYQWISSNFAEAYRMTTAILLVAISVGLEVTKQIPSSTWVLRWLWEKDELEWLNPFSLPTDTPLSESLISVWGISTIDGFLSLSEILAILCSEGRHEYLFPPQSWVWECGILERNLEQQKNIR